MKQSLLQYSKPECSHCDCNTVDNVPPSPWTRPTRCILRPKFLLSGILFGGFMEVLYMHCIRMGYAKLDQTAPLEYSIRMDTWSDLLFYEMSFLGCDIMILLYLIILVRTAMSQNLTLNLAIQAANWTVGIVLGLAGAVSTLVGAQNMLQYRGWEVLASLVVGILLCFLAYSMAVIIQEVWVERRSTQDKEKVRDSSYVAVQIV